MERRAIVVDGIVQGVGFRPFVYRLANDLALSGWVRNESGRVRIEVEGQVQTLERFTKTLESQAPPLARIERVWWQRQAVNRERGFVIEPSGDAGSEEVFISPDIGTCRDCLKELFDPTDRRYRYPFINCTNCGPRLTIITGSPYDRRQTTMAGFPMCEACRTEYEDPADRRYHAQPIACPDCGPQVTAVSTADGQRVGPAGAIETFTRQIQRGLIGALKGLGGYHLVCDARNEPTVAKLRKRKHREEKPFAVMVGGKSEAQRLCEVVEREWTLLDSVRRPIVLMRKRAMRQAAETRGELAESVAPGNPRLGLMLAYTPLHHLIMEQYEKLGGGPLVMTSGNRSDEPIAYDDDQAMERLSGIVDVFLTHDRPIRVRCDDSVTRVLAGVEQPIRRSRGYAPQPITLPFECPQPILAVGGQLKNTFALARGRHAFLSQHMGDLDHYEAYRAFERDVPLYEQLLRIEPTTLACDMHPDYASTRYAQQRRTANLNSQITDASLARVQHHHAHLASCLAEHGLTEPAIGVTFDGTGYGTDGAVWGGEILVGDYLDFQREAHLRYVGMPGGEQAIHEPWRMALAHLLDAGLDPGRLAPAVTTSQLHTVSQMLERRFNTPMTSSVGRLFDAVGSMIGLRHRVSYEGQAAIELEPLAEQERADEAYSFALVDSDDAADPTALVIDTRPMVREIMTDVDRGTTQGTIARRFHSTIVQMVVLSVERIRRHRGINQVALSGGVFLNALLTAEVEAGLQTRGFDVYRHRLVPPGDGGLALGQVAVAATGPAAK